MGREVSMIGGFWTVYTWGPINEIHIIILIAALSAIGFWYVWKKG
jgi:hypothetical protein